MSETPKFLQEMSEEYQRNNDQQEELSRKIDDAWEKWNRAEVAIAKFPEWMLTGEYRAPKKGETFLPTLGTIIPTLCHLNDWPADEPILILRKVEPKPEPPKVNLPSSIEIFHCPKCSAELKFSGPYLVPCQNCKAGSPREEAIRKAKEEAKIARGYFREIAYTGKKLGALIETVEAIPDTPDEPKVVWACPERVVEIIRTIEFIAGNTHLLGLDNPIQELLSLCRSTREATMEEITKAIGNGQFVEVKCIRFPGRPRYEIDIDGDELVKRLNSEGIRLVKEG